MRVDRSAVVTVVGLILLAILGVAVYLILTSGDPDPGCYLSFTCPS